MLGGCAMTLDLFNLIAGVASMLGVGIAIWQLKDVRAKSRLVAEATQRVAVMVQLHSVLSEVAACTQLVAVVRDLLRRRHYPAALYRVEELAARLHSVAHLSWFGGSERHARLREALYQVSLVRTALDHHACGATDDYDSGLQLGRLNKVSDSLNEWSGQLRHEQEERV